MCTQYIHGRGEWVTDILRKHEKSSAFGRLECLALLLSIKYPTISYSVLSISDPQINLQYDFKFTFCESTYIIVQSPRVVFKLFKKLYYQSYELLTQNTLSRKCISRMIFHIFVKKTACNLLICVYINDCCCHLTNVENNKLHCIFKPKISL